jgi:hypothetical protein
MHVSTINKKIYSVELMILYFKHHKHPVKEIDVHSLKHVIRESTWNVDPDTDEEITPFEVMKDLEKYKFHYHKIKQADLSYPIIMYKTHIIDGIHRLVKAIMEKRDKISVYVIKKSLLRKFYIGKEKQFNDNPYNTLINELFNARFSK